MTPQPLLLDRSRFRRIASSLSLMLAGPLVILGILVTPFPDDAAAVARDPLRTQLAADLLFIGYLLIVPGIFAMLRLIGPRGRVLAHVGTVLALFGWITLPGLVLGDFYELAIAQSLGAPQAEALQGHLGDYPGFLVVAAPTKYAAGLGMILLGAALWRAKAVRWWEVAALILWFVTILGLRGRALEPVRARRLRLAELRADLDRFPGSQGVKRGPDGLGGLFPAVTRGPDLRGVSLDCCSLRAGINVPSCGAGK